MVLDILGFELSKLRILLVSIALIFTYKFIKWFLEPYLIYKKKSLHKKLSLYCNG